MRIMGQTKIVEDSHEVDSQAKQTKSDVTNYQRIPSAVICTSPPQRCTRKYTSTLS